MNASIVRLFMLVCALFALLVGFTSRWTVFEAEALRDNRANKRDELQELRIRRGVIRAADGELLARSVAGPGDTFGRRYPTGRLFGHITGFSSPQFSKTGLEQEYSDQLSGRTDDLSTVIRQLGGDERQGDDLITNLDPRAQQVALDALGGRKGSVVAIEPSTGKVRVMTAFPTFDPNTVDDRGVMAALNDPDNDDAPLVFRATQSGYPPGSTFKVVTAAAALDSGRFTPDSVVDGGNGKVISGTPLNNSGGEDFGQISLTTALTNSVNTVWAEVGEKLGKQTMKRYMDRFGFGDQPSLDLPSDQLLASGLRGSNGRILSPTSRRVDIGRVAIGQERLAVSPLQMALVAATVANDGVRMKPRIAERIVDRDGRTTERFEPEEDQQVMSASTARTLTAMMKNVVREGTGTAAALSGVEVAGKTGTAELDIARRINQPWFIGFTSDMAIAVTLERVQGGFGGVDAAPIAKRVLEALGERR